MPKSLFRRGQPVSAGLIQSGRVVVVRTSKPRLLGVTAPRVTNLELPDAAVPVAIASSRQRLLVLGKDAAGKPQLYERRAGKWLPTAVTAELKLAEKTPTLLATDGSSTVIWAGSHLHRRRAGKWTSVAVPKRPGKRPHWPKHAVLHGGRLYLGSDSGEWGGELVSLDIEQPAWRQEPPTGVKPDVDLPVRDLTIDRKGALWVVRGLAHLGLREGMLHRLDPDGFRLIAASKDGRGKQPASKGGDWNLRGTAFDAIAFDDENRPHLLAGSIGVARQKPGGGWTRLTREWPDFVYVQGLAIVGDTAVIGTYDAGLGLLNLTTGATRAVTLH